MLKAPETRGRGGPGETGRRDEDRTDRGERGLERGEPSRPSSGYLRALDSSATEDSLLWKASKHGQTPAPHPLLPRPVPFLAVWRARFGLFHGATEPAVVRSFVAHSAPLLLANVNAATARNGFRSGATSHPRSIRFDDGSPAVPRLRGHRMAWGTYDCLYVTSLLARRRRFNPL